MMNQMLLKRLLLLLMLFSVSVTIAGNLGFSPQFLEEITDRYGYAARDRIESWQNLIEEYEDSGEIERIYAVNEFFSRIRFISDQKHWKRTDYWATPVEFLSTNGGDCEDFSIAKYFTLRELGVPDEKLRITYVKALELNQAHMVLAYYETPESEPMILDNLINDILYASKRQDLLPVYSFNGTNLWMSKERGQGRKVAGGSQRINMWRDLKIRMQQERNLGSSYTASNMTQ